jgi:hypothetical protein
MISKYSGWIVTPHEPGVGASRAFPRFIPRMSGYFGFSEVIVGGKVGVTVGGWVGRSVDKDAGGLIVEGAGLHWASSMDVIRIAGTAISNGFFMVFLFDLLKIYTGLRKTPC